MANQALPFGQVTPTARPIGAFVQAAQPEVAAPVRPVEMPSMRGIDTLQQGGTSNVSGFNQFEQLATSLAPFSKALMETAGQGFVSYAKGKIDQGYYDELKNQHAKAMLSLQTQAETGAANAASQIAQLQKLDPPAAQLLKEANPWKMIGRRRALAQLAGSEIENRLEDDITVNAGERSRLQPGSPELKARQVQITSEVLSKYQLTGDEPETNFYVTPKVNKAWEQYTDKHRKFYNQALEDSTRSTSTAATAELVQRILRTDATVEGVTYKVGTPEWRAYGAATITLAMDQHLQFLDPEARARTVKYMREQIGGVFGNTPYGMQLIQEIRGGDRSMPYEKRPTWGAMAPLDMLELNVRGQKLVQEQHDLGQQRVENQLDSAWYGTPKEKGPGSLDPTDPGYPAALLEFRNTALGMGYLTPEQYITKRANEQSNFTEKARPSDPFEAEDFVVRLGQLGPSAWTDDPNAYANAMKAARQVANREPTKEGKKETYRRLAGEIDKARNAAGEFDAGVRDRVQNEVLQDLDSQAVRQIRDKQKVKGQSGSALDQALAAKLGGGASVATAMAATYQNAKLTAAANQLNALHERAISEGIRNWKNTHPGQIMSPSARSVVMSESAAAARKSQDYARIIKELTGRNPGEVGPATVGPKPMGTEPQQGRGVSREASVNLKPSTAQAYATRAVMEPKWIYSELQTLQKGKPVSKELYNLAKRAGTTTTRYLLEQVRLYPNLDPDGSVKRYLSDQLNQQRGTRTVAGSQLQSVLPGGGGGWNPLAPGGWLMNMLTPPAAAATLDLAPRMSRSDFNFGGGGGGGRWDQGPAAPGSSVDTGRGYTIPGMRDASGRPPVFTRQGANAFAAMVRDSGGQVKGSDISSSQRTREKNNSLPGAAANSLHLGGNAMDIHGTSIAWIRKNGARYGWVVNDYPGSHGGHVEFQGGGGGSQAPTTRRGGGTTGLATFYTGSGGSDGVAGGPTANGERYDPRKMTAAVQWSLRGKYLNKWVTVEDLDTGKSVKVWVNDVGQMGGSERSVNQSDPRMIDLSPAAFKRLFGSTQRGTGRIRIRGVN